MNSDQWTYVGMAIFVVLVFYICYWVVGTQYPGFWTKVCTCKCCNCGTGGSLEQYLSSEVPKSGDSKEKSTESSKSKTMSKSSSYSSHDVYQTTETKVNQQPIDD